MAEPLHPTRDTDGLPSDAEPGDDTGTAGVGGAPGLDERTARRDAILLGTLAEVAFDGWTRSSLIRGAQAAGFAPEAALASFPGGPLEVVEHFSGWADRTMLEQLAAEGLDGLKVREKVTKAVRTRLEILAPYKEAVRRTLSFLALPQHGVVAPRLLYRTVDAMWYAAGDTATDYNYYTKRLLLAGVQSATTLFWVEDRSADHAATWSFLDRRIENVMQIGKGMAGLKGLSNGLGGVLERVPSPFRFARHLRRGMR